MTLPPPPKQSLLLSPNYYRTLKTNSVTLNLNAKEKMEWRVEVVEVGVYEDAARKIFGILAEVRKQFPFLSFFFFFFSLHLVWLQQACRTAAGVFHPG